MCQEFEKQNLKGVVKNKNLNKHIYNRMSYKGNTQNKHKTGIMKFKTVPHGKDDVQTCSIMNPGTRSRKSR